MANRSSASIAPKVRRRKAVAAPLPSEAEALRLLHELKVHQVELELQNEELRQERERIARLLREKEILLREIHHRVKNNMQVISSLLSLQARRRRDPDFTEMVRGCQDRIRSMALVHEKLYLSSDLGRIDFPDYLRILIHEMARSFGLDPDCVRLDFRLDQVFLSVQQAIPCGLIIGELVSNAFKHAFPSGRHGVLKIDLRREPPASLRLSVSDDGVGFSAETDHRQTETFGMEILSLLAHQLGGTLEKSPGPGTEFAVLFPDLDAAGADPS